MISFIESDKVSELTRKVTEGVEIKIESLQCELEQLKKALLKDGTLLEIAEVNCLEKENLTSYSNSALS